MKEVTISESCLVSLRIYKKAIIFIPGGKLVKEITKNPSKWAEELGVKLEVKEPVKPITQKILKTEMSATAFCYQLFLSKDIDYSYAQGKKKFEQNLKDFKSKYFISDLIVDKLLNGKKGSIG